MTHQEFFRNELGTNTWEIERFLYRLSNLPSYKNLETLSNDMVIYFYDNNILSINIKYYQKLSIIIS